MPGARQPLARATTPSEEPPAPLRSPRRGRAGCWTPCEGPAMIRFPNVARPPRSVYRRLNIASGDQRPFDDPLAFTQSGPTCNRSADTPGVSCAYRSRHQPNQRRSNSCPPASFSAPAVGNPVLCSTLPHPCTCTPNPLPAHHPIIPSSTTNLPLQPTQPQKRQRRIICTG
jgi:hypothetical protein